MSLLGGAVGAGLGTGLLLAIIAWRQSVRPTLAQRVLPYVRDVHPQAWSTVAPPSVVTAIFGSPIRRAGRVIGESIGSNAAVNRRLVRLGRDHDLESFRLEQAIWGAAGFGLAVAVSLLAWSWSRPPVLVLLVFCVSGFIAGCLACDQRLTRQMIERESGLRLEFPVVADLIALAVAAGESPVAAIERVAKVSHGALGDELGRILADIRAGRPVPEALGSLAARTGVTSIARFAEAMAVAVERGTPLVDVLHAQASDVREAARRELIESAGRREIAMMLPVVFLILPITVVFAFYPGLIGLHLTSGR